jgi:hypothetical protein
MEFGNGIKIFLYDLVRQSGFQHRLSVAHVGACIPEIMKTLALAKSFARIPQTADAIAREALRVVLMTTSEQHPKEFPRWDLWLRRFPATIEHSGLRSLLLDDPNRTPVQTQVATLAQQMLNTLVSSSGNSGRHREGCCQGLAETLINLGRLSLLNGTNRVQVLQTLFKQGPHPELLLMVGYQHQQQPFTPNEIDQLLHTASRDFNMQEVNKIAQTLGYDLKQTFRLWVQQTQVARALAFSILMLNNHYSAAHQLVNAMKNSVQRFVAVPLSVHLDRLIFTLFWAFIGTQIVYPTCKDGLNHTWNAVKPGYDVAWNSYNYTWNAAVATSNHVATFYNNFMECWDPRGCNNA